MKKYFYLLPVLLLSQLNAAEYYVSPKGKNSNPGTKESPFATVSFAAAKAKAGDTVNILPGIYRENINISNQGSKNAPIIFKGVRGKNGKYLSILEASGKELSKWQPAPEISPEVWKIKLPKRPNGVLVDGKMIIYINSRTMAMPKDNVKRTGITGRDITHRPFGKNCKRIPGLDLLGLDKDIKMLGGKGSQLGNRNEPFFPTIGNIMAGWRKKVLYIRFADGSTPEKHAISVHYGNGFNLTGAKHLTFKDLHMRNSCIQVRIAKKSSNITIDNCLLMNGRKRVEIDRSSSDITIKNSILTSGFIQPKHYASHGNNDKRGRVIYLTFKYIVGTALSDDLGVEAYGKNITICDNVISDGLIGMRAFGPGMKVYNNVISRMASCGIVTGARTVGEFHHNLVSYCGILQRFHNLREAHAKRVEYHYNNLYLQHQFRGVELFVFCGSHLTKGADRINFEPGTAIYKKNPPKPVYPGDFFIYHNTIWGGNRIAPAFNAKRVAQRFREPFPFCLVNNIMRYSFLLNNWQHVFDNNLLYLFSNMGSRQKGDPAIIRQNKILTLEESENIWKKGKKGGIPNIELADNSPALGTGIDVSKPFSYRGRKYSALPGFKPGYFKGKAPAAGALQPDESMAHFVKLAKKLAAARKFID